VIGKATGGRRFGAALAVLCSLLLLLALAGGGCERAPYPSEVGRAVLLDEDLVRIEAPRYASEGYARHRADLSLARDLLAEQERRFVFLRDYGPVGERFRAVLAQGAALQEAVRASRDGRAQALAERVEGLGLRIALLREVTELMNEGRLGRRSLMRAEVALDDARRALDAGDLDGSEALLPQTEERLRTAEQNLGRVVCRYLDAQQLNRWRRIADGAVAESNRTGGLTLLVLKLERKLVVYRDGKPQRSYRVGLGGNGLSDKLYQGDHATPEGRYTVVRRVPNSRYHKALLLDYPNEEDRERFARAKAAGQVPAGRSIGSLIEIHGGGRNSVTEGCVSLDNPAMDELFDLVGPGTPVYIAGTLTGNDLLRSVCPKKGR